MGSGESKLASSVQRGDLQGVKAALKSGEDADCNNKGDFTPLHKASEAGYHNIAVALIDARANIHAKDKRANTLDYEPLHFAAENGHKNIVLLVLCAGASLSSKTAKGDQPIHFAVKGNHHSVVSELVSAGADLSSTDGSGKLPLQIAVEKGQVQIVQSLLNANVDLSAKDINGNGVLHLASLSNHLNVVCALISADVDVSAKNTAGQMPLHIAVKNGNAQITQALVNAGSDISAKDENGDQVHHIAASDGHAKIMDILLKAEVDLLDFDSEGNQALHLAAENGHHSVVSSLLTAGADLTTQSWQGNTAAHIAALHGFTEVLKVLKKHGDDFTAFSNNDRKETPLHSATENDHIVAVQWLVKNGAQLESQNGAGVTPVTLARCNFHQVISNWFDRVQEQRTNVLKYAKYGDFSSVLSALDVGAKASKDLLHIAILAGKVRVVQAIVGQGTNLENSSFFYRYRPLHYAAEEGHSQVVLELLKAGADHTAIDYKGRTAMHLAAGANHQRVIEVMKSYGCNLNIISDNCWKWTPLHYAACSGHISTVKWLVWNGADTEAKDSYGNTPVKCASKRKHRDIVQWLLNGANNPPNQTEEKSTSPTGECADMKQEEIRIISEQLSCNQEFGDCEVPEICYMSVEGTCSNEEKCCKRLHSDRHYHWQAKEPFGGWLNLPEKQVVCLESAFCNPSQDEVSLSAIEEESSGFTPTTLIEILGSESWKSNFKDMTLIDRNMRRIIKIRRLCSEKLDDKPLKPSQFAWYFVDRNKKWVKYGNADTTKESCLATNISSNDIEERFTKNPTQIIYFKNTKFQYKLDFTTMMQTNINTSVCREVRRRPQPHPIRRSENVKTDLQADKSLNWPPQWEAMESRECLKRVELSSSTKEYQDICASLQNAVYAHNVEKIERVQNTFMWIAFQNKVREMSTVYGNDYEVNIRQLFHGTNPSVVDKICSENFDWRLHGSSTGQMYGRGTYFSPNAKTAYAYCNADSSGRYYIFLAQVAVGTYVVGNSEMVRPPTNPSNGKLYDSTVDSEFNPNIIVKYDKQEYYPEYIVTINKNPFIRTASNANCIIS